MSKTAIVPVEPSAEMDRVADEMRFYDYVDPDEAYKEMVSARPPVPDELIEEAAEMIYLTACRWRVALGVVTDSWQETTEAVRNEYRDMARAAARVFNGGRDE